MGCVKKRFLRKDLKYWDDLCKFKESFTQARKTVWEKGFCLEIYPQCYVECPALTPLPSQAFINMSVILYNFV